MLTMVCRTCYKQNNSKKNIIIIYFKNRNTKLKNILYVGLEMTPCVTVGSNEMIWTVNVQLDSHSNNIIQYLMVTLFYYILLYFILLYFIIFYCLFGSSDVEKRKSFRRRLPIYGCSRKSMSVGMIEESIALG